MTSLHESLARAQQRLTDRGIASAAIGAMAVNVWGRARATNDVDLKVALDRDQARTLLEALIPEYELLGEHPLHALEQVGFIFTRDSTGNRVDFLLSDIGFDAEAIARAKDIEIRRGLIVRVCTAEDLIVYKLISTRPRDQEDARTVIVRQAKSLDVDHITRWLREFELALDDSTLINTFEDMLRRARH